MKVRCLKFYMLLGQENIPSTKWLITRSLVYSKITADLFVLTLVFQSGVSFLIVYSSLPALCYRDEPFNSISKCNAQVPLKKKTSSVQLPFPVVLRTLSYCRFL